MKLNQKGFSVVEGILIVVVVVLLGVVGWFVYDSNHNKAPNTTATSTSTTPISTTKTTPAPGPYDGWNSYENKELGFKYSYPKDWKAENSASQCPASAMDYNASVCPLAGSLNAQAYLDYQNKKYGHFMSPLVSYMVFKKSDKSLDALYQEFKSEYASQDGYTSAPSTTLTINGLKGFYVNQKTNSYSDNIYVVQLASGTYIQFTNRESDKHYTPGGASVDDQNDYTSYTTTVDKIVKSLSPL